MTLSIVTTLYYSRDYLYEFYTRTRNTVQELGLDYEFVFVDDGSPDDSLNVVLDLQKHDSNISIIELSRNFGHQRAIMTGLQNTTGDYIYLIDCDLEEPPELLKTFWQTMHERKDADVVYGVQSSRKGGWFERSSGSLFYKTLSMVSSIDYPADTLTARVMSRTYVNAVLRYEEKELDLWGIFVLVGFNQVPITVTKASKGTTTYTFHKKAKVAIEIITSFSHRPLYITFFLGIISFLVAVVNIAVIVYKKIYWDIDVEGWASILASVWLVGGMILLMLGIFGLYLSKMFLEIKNRPLAVIKNVYRK